jgi:hypothetical protein
MDNTTDTDNTTDMGRAYFVPYMCLLAVVFFPVADQNCNSIWKSYSSDDNYLITTILMAAGNRFFPDAQRRD